MEEFFSEQSTTLIIAIIVYLIISYCLGRGVFSQNSYLTVAWGWYMSCYINSKLYILNRVLQLHSQPLSLFM